MKTIENKKAAILVYYFAQKAKTLHNFYKMKEKDKKLKKVFKKVLTFQKLHSIIQNVPCKRNNIKYIEK